MNSIDLLRDIFDEKIVSIIEVFLDNPFSTFSPTEIALLSKVHVATTLRIISRLVDKGILEITVKGKTKSYRLQRGERTMALLKFLKKDEHLTEFLEALQKIPRIKAVVLEAKTRETAKVLIVGDFLPTERINRLVEAVKEKYGFKIQFIEITEKQFQDMSGLGLYDLSQKIIWANTA